MHAKPLQVWNAHRSQLHGSEDELSVETDHAHSPSEPIYRAYFPRPTLAPITSQGGSLELTSRTLVTGGTSFIGSHLVEQLTERVASLRIVDNLSSGRFEYVRPLIADGVDVLQGDLLDQDTARKAVDGIDLIFHLAADHGGRGYVDLHQAACASNLALDGILFDAATRAGVEKIVYASSGCVYPNFRSNDPDEILYLTEDVAGPPFDADNMYGWAKLMAEMTLQSYAEERDLKAASCRYFTVYGERGKEDHAVIAMIARAFIKQDPFVVWGDGQQIRNWTYVGRHRRRHDRGRGAHRRRHAGQPRHDGANEGDRCRARGHGLHRASGAGRAASRDADRTDEPRGRQHAGAEAHGLGTPGELRRRSPPDDRLVLRDEGPRRGGGHARGFAHRALTCASSF